MVLYLLVTALTILLSTLTRVRVKAGSRQQAINVCALMAIFLVLFFVSALRVRTGNDYWWYTNIMHEASVGGHVPTEAGFNLIVRAVYTVFGYENYLFVFALMSFATVTLFLFSIWRMTEDFAMSFAMFLLLGYYLQSFSTVRYYAVLPCALLALYYCDRGDWPRFVLIVLCAALVHKSILVILVFYPLCRMRWRVWMAALMGAVSAAVFLLPAQVMRLALLVYPTYANATDRGDSGFSLFNVARCVLVIGFVWWNTRGYLYLTEEDSVELRRMRTWSKMTVMALCVYIGGARLPQISRIAYYLTLPQILLLPSVCMRIPERETRRLMRGIVLVACVLVFMRYLLHAADDGIRVLPYRTFLFYEG
ncbi:MAG: EpsG family protein [Lachnospiraceae bacterium]|nr:EpsG family protein [Lachnospiraceae bacterium]